VDVSFRPRAVFIEWDGRRILCCDYAGLEDQREALDAFDQVRRAVAKEPPGTVLTLSDVRASRLDRTMQRKLMELTIHNRDFVRAAAVVGLSPDQRRDLAGIERVSGRQFTVFDTLEEARDWLVAHP
jgi:hypothetical protein